MAIYILAAQTFRFIQTAFGSVKLSPAGGRSER
jgi:hypothetical protein